MLSKYLIKILLSFKIDSVQNISMTELYVIVHIAVLMPFCTFGLPTVYLIKIITICNKDASATI